MKQYKTLTLAVFFVLLWGGVAHSQRDEDRWVRGRVGPQWELMTKQVINFRDDRDHINIANAGRHNGRFTQVMIRADGAPRRNSPYGDKFRQWGKVRSDQSTNSFG